MAIDQVARINGVTFAWNSCLFKANGQAIEGVVSCDYGETLESPLVYAAKRSGKPVAYAGGGKYTPPVFKVKMLKDTFAIFQLYIASAGGGLGSYGSAGLPGFTWQMQAVEELSGLVVITANASQCRVKSKNESKAEGAEVLLTEVEITSLDFIENGVPLWSIAREATGI